MIVWLVIGARQYHANALALSHLGLQAARHELLASVGTLRATTDAETANVTVTLRNGAGQCSGLFASAPPIGAAAALHTPAGLVFAGTVASIALDAGDCRVSIAA